MIDGLLRLVVQSVELDPKREMFLVVAVNGMLVSGRMVSRRHFFEAGIGKEATDKIWLTPSGEDGDATPRTDKPVKLDEIEFMHLGEAFFFGTARGIAAVDSPQLVRINLGHVTAFFFGRLTEKGAAAI